MNVTISTDSSLLCSRLQMILSEIPEVNITRATKNLDEANDVIKNNDVQVLIVAFHSIAQTFFKTLQEIKESNNDLIVIVLSNNPAKQYLTQWKNAGADHVFDQAFHFHKMIDVLSGRIYKNLLESLKSDAIQ